MSFEASIRDKSIQWIAFAGCVSTSLVIWTLSPTAFAVAGRVLVPQVLDNLIGAQRVHNVAIMAALLVLAVPFTAGKAFLLWRGQRDKFLEARDSMFQHRRELRSDLRKVLMSRAISAALGLIAMVALVSKRAAIDSGFLSIAITGIVCFLVMDFIADSLKYGPIVRYTRDTT